MLSNEKIRTLLMNLESDRVERTISTTNTDKFGQVICAFANDLPNNRKPGYLFLGVNDDGSIHPIDVTDELLKNIAGIRTDGNIQPQPSMVVEKISFPEGDIVAVEVQPHVFPPVRYKGRVWVRVGPRKGIASEADERVLMEKRNSNVLTFDATPYFNATLDDLDLNLFRYQYLPKTMPEEELTNDRRDVKYQLSSLGFYDTRYDCPTNAGVLLFAKNLRRLFPGAYIQYVRYKGTSRAGEILMEHEFKENLCVSLQEMDTFINTTIINRRPIPVSALREESVIDYPYWATRELLMNAICHRDYSSNGPIQFYQYDDRIEILNHGGLYGRATIENFPNVNDYRNLVVAEAMKVLGFVNRQSRGVIRVKEDLERNENGAPLYDFSYGTAVLVIEHKSAIPDRLIALAIEQGLIESESDIKPSKMGENNEGNEQNAQKYPKMGENEDKKTQKTAEVRENDGGNTQKYPKMGENAHFPTLAIKNILELLRQNPKIRYIDLQENLGIDDNTVHRSIAWLKENGYINKEHSKVKGVWQLLP